MELAILKTIIPATLTFLVGIGITPFVTHYLYRYRVWKKRGGKEAFDGTQAYEFNRLHAQEETRTPRMGGIVVWGSVACVTAVLWVCAHLFPDRFVSDINILSREQTWIPFFTLLLGALVGFWNDVLDIQPHARGLRLRERLLFVIVLSSYVGWWMYAKLGIVSVAIPFASQLVIGVWVIPLFVALSMALYASGVIDGVDGLSGGVFASIFAAYGVIAFTESQFTLAAFCISIVGGLLAFVWFNVPPARFYMSETGTMGLTLSLASICFLTDVHGGGYGISVLPIIAFLLVVTVLSNVVQIISKRVLKRKVFRVAPLHHHFEAIGWSTAKVTMRYWILSVMFASTGIMISLILSAS